MTSMPSEADHSFGSRLVAHRGLPNCYPENTLIGLRAAVESGAQFIEFDVQLSKDGVPVVIHDTDLQRTAGVQGDILGLSLEQISKIEVNEQARFGKTYTGIEIPTLAQMGDFIASVHQLTAFVEIKRSSLRKFGHQAVVEPIMQILQSVLKQCVLISFDAEAVVLARSLGADRIGWVFEDWTRENHCIAEKLAPDFLFCDHEVLPAQEVFWPGPWQWAFYETSDPEIARQLIERGADLVETDAIGDMLKYFSAQTPR